MGELENKVQGMVSTINRQAKSIKELSSLVVAIEKDNDHLMTLVKKAKAEFDSDIDYLPVPTQVEVSKILEELNNAIKQWEQRKHSMTG